MTCINNKKDDARTLRRLKRLLKLKQREMEKRVLDRGRKKRPPALLVELRREIEALARRRDSASKTKREPCHDDRQERRER